MVFYRTIPTCIARFIYPSLDKPISEMTRSVFPKVIEDTVILKDVYSVVSLPRRPRLRDMPPQRRRLTQLCPFDYNTSFVVS